eukprot:TRINITY_DN44860_c0_g1_i1.p1 TRINITY_DN44860_c0_g1~~TRINITY_DN44860_c0_g1_i1.p1  ORF type:complete len:596 (+),score=98.84 TRINITY_DN44860_c0_g1_i1:25-1812(+)
MDDGEPPKNEASEELIQFIEGLRREVSRARTVGKEPIVGQRDKGIILIEPQADEKTCPSTGSMGIGPSCEIQSVDVYELVKEELLNFSNRMDLQLARYEQLLLGSIQTGGLAENPSASVLSRLSTNLSIANNAPDPEDSCMSKRKMTAGLRFTHYRNAYTKKAEELMIHRRKAMVITLADTRLQRVVGSSYFEFGMLLLVAVNVILMGVELDVSIGLPASELPSVYRILDNLCTGFYFTEVIVKVLAFGCRYYFYGPENRWNILDLVVVATSLLEVVTQVFESVGILKQMRALRLVRVVRSLKVVRVLRLISALRTLVVSILGTLRPLGMAVVLLMVMFYGFGLFITQTATDYCREQAIMRSGDSEALPRCDGSALHDYFGSLPATMSTLFQSISNGVSWAGPAKDLAEVGWWAVLMFNLFIVIAAFVIMNVLTGIFCQSAMEAAVSDREIAMLNRLASKNEIISALATLFSIVDTDKSNTITFDEFETAMENDSVVAVFESLDIDTGDAALLFHLMDIDMSGTVDLDELVTGCIRYRNNATAMQVAHLAYEHKLTQRIVMNMEEILVNMDNSLFPGRAKAERTFSMTSSMTTHD